MVVSPAIALAQSPALVPVQGRLTDSDGTPITTAVTLTIAIYDSQSSVTPLYSEQQSVTPNEAGRFVAYAGVVTPLDLNLFATQSETWVGITVGDDAELTPRFRLGTTPYAAYATQAGSLQGATADDFATRDHTHAFSELTAIPAGLEDGDDVLDQRTVEAFAQAVCYDTPAELVAALPGWDTNASNDLTTGTTFQGDVAGRYNALQIAPRSVGSAEVEDKSLTKDDLADNSIGTAQIINESLTATDLGTNSVTASEIATNAVRAEEIAENAVGPSELNLRAVFEPAQSTIGGSTVDLTTSTFRTIIAESISVPTSGTVIALAAWEHRSLSGTANTGDEFVLTTSPTGTTGIDTRFFFLASTGTQFISGSLHNSYAVGPGNFTVYLRGRSEDASRMTFRVYKARLTLFFIPN